MIIKLIMIIIMIMIIIIMIILMMIIMIIRRPTREVRMQCRETTGPRTCSEKYYFFLLKIILLGFDWRDPSREDCGGQR